MALNFPNSPGIGSVYTDSVSGFSYEWDGTVWKSYSPASSSNIRILDDISGSFNGIGKTFALISNSIAVYPPSPQSLIINLGGVVQDPSDDYSVSGSNIIFSDAPTSGLTFSGVSLGPAVPISTILDGTTTQGSLNVVGLLSAANLIVSGVSTFQSNIKLGDNDNLYFGDGNDLRILHEGGYSLIEESGTGPLYLQSNGTGFIFRKTDGENLSVFNTDGSVELYYDNSKEFETTGYGATVFGILQTQGLQVSGVSTFTSSPVLIGSATSTGTASQLLQVTGGGYFSGSLAIGTTSPTSTNGGLDIASGGLGLVVGADVNATTRTDSTQKNARIVVPHYTNSEEPFGLLVASSGSTFNFLAIGGGTATVNAATEITFNTASSTTTVTGTERMRVTSSGNVGIATANPTQALHVVGNALITGNITGAAATFTNLTVNGTQTIINTTTLEVLDKNIGIGSTSTPTDTLADGSGITIYGTTNKTLTYNNTKKGFETNIPIATNETRIISGAEKVHRQSGNTVTLTYNSSSSSNVGYTTNPTGDITVNVVGIPTSSDFDDHSITFAVIVNNTGTARTCTAVNLNGVPETIRWAGGSLSAALSGVTTTTGHTIFSFTGINTVGSASTAANYQVLGVVSGGFW